jgi:Rrf2 family protein
MWAAFPIRLQSAFKALCYLADAKGSVRSPEIADHIGVPRAETAKVLQLLVWGGFVSSQRGTKGGFRLVQSPHRITAGAVIRFFLARHPARPEKHSRVIRILQESMAPCQEAFSKLSLTELAGLNNARPKPAGTPTETARRAGLAKRRN